MGGVPSKEWALQLFSLIAFSTSCSNHNRLLFIHSHKHNFHIQVLLENACLWVCNKEIITNNLHLLTNFSSHLSIVFPVILIKGIFN